MVEFRDYQIEIIEKGFKQCLSRRWCYLAMEVRTGKSLTSLGIASKLGGTNKRVVFVTKKKAFNSIEKDVKLLNDANLQVEVINYESLHKLDVKVKHIDVWILDEAHRLGSFPKPCKAVTQLQKMIHKYSSVIFLSGTPTPESNAQIFHQLSVLGQNSPFNGYNFYQWARLNCNITEKRFGHGYPVKDYSDCFFDLKSLNFLTYSQKEAGFKNVINEHFITIEMLPITKRIIDTLKKDKVFNGTNDVILADTKVKEMQKIHQLSSGTCKLESGKAVIIDETKAIFIKDNFDDNKLAIFYKFKEELELLKKHLDITDNLDEFNTTDKHIALQFVSGREGIKLNKADMIIAFNIDFSATTYFQFRDRMTTIDRINSDVYWLFSDCGIERQVYSVVKNKDNFTSQYYDRATNSEKDNNKTRERGLLCSKANKNKQERDTRPNCTQTQLGLFG